MRAILVGLALAAGTLAAADAQAPPEVDLTRTLAQVAQRLEGWYGRAQRIVSRETVTIQPLRADLAPAEPPRRLTFDLRVGWEVDPESASSAPVASVVRQSVSVGGRSVRRDQDPGCMDPKPVSPEPLALLLAERQHESEFVSAGRGRVDNRPTVLIDFRGIPGTPPRVTWTGECVSISLPGQSRGRIWVDAMTHDVLRLDERLVGEFRLPVPRDQVRRGAAPTMVVERAESSIRYRQVRFEDPVEQLLLPSEIQTFTVIRGVSTSRVRMTQRFSEHRRFLTDGRLVD
jgi:hypothetical protein